MSSICKHPFSDLFLFAHGNRESRDASYITLYSLTNTYYPEVSLKRPKNVSSTAWSEVNSKLLAIGYIDGSIEIIDFN